MHVGCVCTSGRADAAAHLESLISVAPLRVDTKAAKHACKAGKEAGVSDQLLTQGREKLDLAIEAQRARKVPSPWSTDAPHGPPLIILLLNKPPLIKSVYGNTCETFEPCAPNSAHRLYAEHRSGFQSFHAAPSVYLVHHVTPPSPQAATDMLAVLLPPAVPLLVRGRLRVVALGRLTAWSSLPFREWRKQWTTYETSVRVL